MFLCVKVQVCPEIGNQIHTYVKADGADAERNSEVAVKRAPTTRSAAPSKSRIEDRRGSGFYAAARAGVLVGDGGMSTALARFGFAEKDFRAGRALQHVGPVVGNWELLCDAQPNAVTAVHHACVRAGANLLFTNSFGANPDRQRAFGMEAHAYDLSRTAAKLARKAADTYQGGPGSDASAGLTGRNGIRRWVVGVLGPPGPLADVSRGSGRSETTREPSPQPTRASRAL